MRSIRKLALISAILAISGCRTHNDAPDEAPMPPNTILLSQMMRELSAQPGFTEGMLAAIDKGGEKRGPALLTPTLVDELRKRILGQNWQGLDHFPAWAIRRINPAVAVAGQIAGKNQTVENLTAVHPGTPPSNAPATEFLDLGPYAIDKAETVSLNTPSTLPGFTTQGITTDLGSGVTRGDGPNEFASEHAQSQRLADALNRLAANKLDGAAEFIVTVSNSFIVEQVKTPRDLIAALQATGHEVTVSDARYFANFAHLHYKGQDVMAPFWINTQIPIPGTKNRPLLVPVAHAEYEWRVRGPAVNADISYYFGVDGKSQWRTMDTRDQAWVLKRVAYEYRSTQAVEVTRLAGLLTVAYMHLHASHPELPFGGYYALGVCQDGISAIERKVSNHVTLYPNTADLTFFKDIRDAEVNKLMGAVPKDRSGVPPDPERLFGSLPMMAAPNSDFSTVGIPGLAADLSAVHAAWTNGTLVRPGATKKGTSRKKLLLAALVVIAIIGIAMARRRNIDDF